MDITTKIINEHFLPHLKDKTPCELKQTREQVRKIKEELRKEQKKIKEVSNG